MRMAMNKLRDRLQKRDETGAGALLPIISIGTIILIIAASVASTVAFASTISSDQRVAIEADIELKSVLNSFETSMLSGSPMPTATIDAAGSYKTYYSAADTAPSSVTDPGVAYVPGTGIPSGARWLLAEVTTESGQDELAVYRFAPGDSNRLMGRAIVWDGTINVLSNSKIVSAPGVLTPLSIVGSSRSGSGLITVQGGSTVEGNIYAEYTGSSNTFNNGKLEGNFFSSRPLSLAGGSKIIGDGYADSITGADAVAGVLGKRVTGAEAASTRPKVAIPTTTTNKYDIPPAGVNKVTLLDAQCSSPALIKGQIESYTVPTMIVLPETCLSSTTPFNGFVKPKTKIYISSATALVLNLTVDGSAGGELSFTIDGTTAIENVNYINGAKGAIASGGTTTVKDSKITGAFSELTGTSAGSLDMTANVELTYYPVDFPVAQSCSSTCVTSVPQLIRVS